MNNDIVKHDDLIIPVYLNQRVVFDLVAMLRGGIASVTTVSEMDAQSRRLEAEAGGKFGLTEALSSLLRIDFSGKAAGTRSGENAEHRTEQRIHTPASLFIALRALLREKELITIDTPKIQPEPGQILEFSAVLKRNPLVEMLALFGELLNMAEAFSEKPQTGKGGQGGREQRQLQQQLEKFIASLNAGDTMDLITGPLQSTHRAVITLDKQFLNDQSMSDLVDGNFRVVGKITRVIGPDEGAISLNRKTALAALPSHVLAELEKALKQSSLQTWNLPELEWNVPGPVIQVIPISIFA